MRTVHAWPMGRSKCLKRIKVHDSLNQMSVCNIWQQIIYRFCLKAMFAGLFYLLCNFGFVHIYSRVTFSCTDNSGNMFCSIRHGSEFVSDIKVIRYSFRKSNYAIFILPSSSLRVIFWRLGRALLTLGAFIQELITEKRIWSHK